MVRRWTVTIALAACGPTVGLPAHSDEATSTTATTTGTDSTRASTTSTTSTPTTSTPPVPTSDGETGPDPDLTDDAGTVPDVGPCDGPFCSTWDQGCADGQRCVSTDVCGVEGEWSATTCIVLGADPGRPGDPCAVEDHLTSGADDCDIATMCFYIDPRSLTGTCVAMCSGYEDDPVCNSADDRCMVANGGVLHLCLPACDPLADACGAGQGCHPVASDREDFACLPDDAPVEIEALYPTDCPAGETAVPPERLSSQCDGGDTCCAAYCPANTPDSCDPGLACQPWVEPAIGPGVVGVCVDP